MPLPYALWVNWRYLKPAGPASVPASWPFDAELSTVLDDSLRRLEIVEAKGPGLAGVCGVVSAGIGIAIATRWHTDDAFHRSLLVIAAAYAFMSLYAPFVLLGSLRRYQINYEQLLAISKQPDANHVLSQLRADSATYNVTQTLRLGNLQSASRDALRNATFAFALWLLLLLVHKS